MVPQAAAGQEEPGEVAQQAAGAIAAAAHSVTECAALLGQSWQAVQARSVDLHVAIAQWWRQLRLGTEEDAQEHSLYIKIGRSQGEVLWVGLSKEVETTWQTTCDALAATDAANALLGVGRQGGVRSALGRSVVLGIVGESVIQSRSSGGGGGGSGGGGGIESNRAFCRLSAQAVLAASLPASNGTNRLCATSIEQRSGKVNKVLTLRECPRAQPPSPPLRCIIRLHREADTALIAWQTQLTQRDAVRGVPTHLVVGLLLRRGTPPNSFAPRRSASGWRHSTPTKPPSGLTGCAQTQS
jgi:hypothetical protein